jgi:cation transport ATPase
VVVLYLLFAKYSKDKRAYRQFILLISGVAFFLNLIWELAQGFLYVSFKLDLKHISFCALASITDMLTTLILLFGFALIYKNNVFWIQRMSALKVMLLMVLGGSSTILIEMWHIEGGDWVYAEKMAMLPLLDVGVSPVLQFMLLPWITFLIGKNVIKKI